MRPSSSACGSSSGAPTRTRCQACAGSRARPCARSSRTRPVSRASTRRRPRSPTTSPLPMPSPTTSARGAAASSGREVRAISRANGRALVATTADEFEFDLLVICAGLHSDRLARLAGDARSRDRPLPRRVLPARSRARAARARPDLPGSRPRATPSSASTSPGRVRGGVDVGPNAVLAFAREGYRRRDVRVGDLARRSAAGVPGAGAQALADGSA